MVVYPRPGYHATEAVGSDLPEGNASDSLDLGSRLVQAFSEFYGVAIAGMAAAALLFAHISNDSGEAPWQHGTF